MKKLLTLAATGLLCLSGAPQAAAYDTTILMPPVSQLTSGKTYYIYDAHADDGTANETAASDNCRYAFRYDSNESTEVATAAIHGTHVKPQNATNQLNNRHVWRATLTDANTWTFQNVATQRYIANASANTTNDESARGYFDVETTSNEGVFTVKVHGTNNTRWDGNGTANCPMVYWGGAGHHIKFYEAVAKDGGYELSANNAWNVTYTYQAYDGVSPTRVVSVPDGDNAADHIPAFDFFTPTGITETGNAAIVNENQKSFTVSGSWNFPMEFEKVYRVRLKPSLATNKNIKYNGTNVLLQYDGNENGDELAAEYLWYFKYVNFTDGVLKVTMHGLAADNDNGIFIGTGDKSNATITTSPTTFAVKPTTWEDKIDGDFCLKHSTANNWINDRDSYFSTWASSWSEGDGGSVLRLSSLTENDFELLGYCNSATDVEAAEANPSQEKIRPLVANFNANDIDDYNIINNANAFAALGIASESAVNDWNTFKASLIHSGEFTTEQSASIVTAYQTLVNSSANTPGGAHIKLSTNVVPGDYMIARLINNAYSVGRYGNDVNGNKTTWTLKQAQGGFYLYNENSGKYAQFPTDDNTGVTPVATVSDASTFVFDLYDAATARYGIKCVNTQGDNCYLYTSADEGVSEPNKIFRGAKAANSSWYLHASDATTATNEANIGANEDMTNARNNCLISGTIEYGTELGQYTDRDGAYAIAIEQFNNTGNDATNEAKHAAAGALRAAFPGMHLNMPEAGTYLTFNGASNEKVALFYTTATYNHNGNAKTVLDKTDTNAGYNTANGILYYDGSHLLSYSTGYYLGLSSAGWPTFISDADMAANGRGNTSATIGIAPGSHAGLYQLNYARPDNDNCGLHINTVTANGVTHLFGDRCGLGNRSAEDLVTTTRNEDAHNWKIALVNELPVAIHADGYGSFIAPVAVSFNENPVYVGSVSGNVLTFTEQSTGEVIAPNSPVIVKGTQNTTVNATIHYDYVAPVTPAVLTTDESTIRLEGKYIAENKAAETDLSTFAKTSENATLTDDSTVKLNKVADGSVIPVNTLLLTLHNNSELIAADDATATIDLMKDNVTGISAIEFRNLDGTREIYDLQGRRLAAPVKGINIVNGKKIYVK